MAVTTASPLTPFVDDLLARRDTTATLAALHDYLLDHSPGAAAQISLLRTLLEDGGRWNVVTDFTLEAWQTHHIPELIMGSVTRDTLRITDRRSFNGECWFTWKEPGYIPDDTSDIPLDVMKFLPGWIVEKWTEDDSNDSHWAWAAAWAEVTNPNDALNLAAFDWAVSSLRQFFSLLPTETSP